MGANYSSEIEPYTASIRCLLALNHVKEALLGLLHNVNNDVTYTGIPTNPVDLYNELAKVFVGDTLAKLKKKKLLKDDQVERLLPMTSQTDSNEWDITLQVIVIKNCLQNRLPKQKLDFVDKARELRNEIIHQIAGVKNLPNDTFQEVWKRLEDVLNGLGYNHMKLLKDLENQKVVPENELTELQKLLKNSRNEIDDKHDNNDDVHKKEVLARYDEIIEKMSKKLFYLSIDIYKMFIYVIVDTVTPIFDPYSKK